MTAFDKIHPFLISLVISLIVGIERERSHPRGSQAIGVRTFMLLGLSGTLAAFLESSSQIQKPSRRKIKKRSWWLTGYPG
jgi:uncharacterized membrane protein YhiD involved in acid resistance